MGTLVRGRDRYHHYDPEPRPRRDYGPEEIAPHRKKCEGRMAKLYDDGGGPPPALQ